MAGMLVVHTTNVPATRGVVYQHATASALRTAPTVAIYDASTPMFEMDSAWIPAVEWNRASAPKADSDQADTKTDLRRQRRRLYGKRDLSRAGLGLAIALPVAVIFVAAAAAMYYLWRRSQRDQQQCRSYTGGCACGSEKHGFAGRRSRSKRILELGGAEKDAEAGLAHGTSHTSLGPDDSASMAWQNFTRQTRHDNAGSNEDTRQGRAETPAMPQDATSPSMFERRLQTLQSEQSWTGATWGASSSGQSIDPATFEIEPSRAALRPSSSIYTRASRHMLGLYSARRGESQLTVGHAGERSVRAAKHYSDPGNPFDASVVDLERCESLSSDRSSDNEQGRAERDDAKRGAADSKKGHAGLRQEASRALDRLEGRSVSAMS